MPLADTPEAIGAVTDLVRGRLSARLNSLNVSVGRPQAAATAGTGPKLNLFLYRIAMDGHLRNTPLDEGQPPPLWMVLHYLLTAFDTGRDSDSIAAHRLLGRGLAALHEINFLRPPVTAAELTDNPEPLKVTFDEADADLLSKLMQGSEEQYRVSAAFQVRPVLIAPDATPSYAPLVLSVGPPATPGVVVLPTLGAVLDALEPERFEAGASLTVTGTDLGGYTEVWIGDQSFPATPGPERTLTATVPLATTLSARAYPVCVARVLPSGRRVSSNAVLGHLAPTVAGAAIVGVLANAGTVANPLMHGTLTLNGRRLGGPDDAVFVAFYLDGETRLMLEVTGTAAQTSLTATVPAADALPPGQYRIILRVNGEQAANSPQVNWT
ncbi:MAG TPA: DUF4255 domain-containing protein [Pelomicrobium sp.]|nr:DUF4255 domain-containing protein [Pelomicrobium sp.]